MASGVDMTHISELADKLDNPFIPAPPKEITEEGQDRLSTYVAAYKWTETSIAKEICGSHTRKRFLEALFKNFCEAEPMVTAGITFDEYKQWFTCIEKEVKQHHWTRFMDEGRELVIETIGVADGNHP